MEIIFVGGPRGSGKSTLIRRLLKDEPEIEAIHMGTAIVRAKREGIAPEDYIKKRFPGRTVVVEGKFAFAPPHPHKYPKIFDFIDGVALFPSASKLIFVGTEPNILDRRIAHDPKRRVINPRHRLAEWTAARLCERKIHHIDTSSFEPAYRKFRDVVRHR